MVSEGGLTPEATSAGDTDPASALASEAIPGRENGNNPEEAASMTAEDWATLARP
ncbi:hypothetical protein [Dactylosporangium sp. NPDC049140]|uniref:hypothetical protein n=1 Tax=Dactylosporangium sp. NPDC049140 TaxID=3155647 RepID=UPI0033F53096